MRGMMEHMVHEDEAAAKAKAAAEEAQRLEVLADARHEARRAAGI